MTDFYELHRCQDGRVERRLRAGPAIVNFILLAVFSWAVIWAAVSLLKGIV